MKKSNLILGLVVFLMASSLIYAQSNQSDINSRGQYNKATVEQHGNTNM